MEIKNFNRVEVITKIESIKVMDDDRYEWYKIVSINNWALVPMYFDLKNLFIEWVTEEEKLKYEEMMQEKSQALEKEWKKLSTKDMTEAYNKMPKFLEQLTVLHMWEKGIKNFIDILTDILNKSL